MLASARLSIKHNGKANRGSWSARIEVAVIWAGLVHGESAR